MKRVLLFSIFMSIVFFSNCLAASNINVTINGDKVQYNNDLGYPYIDENNRTMVPLRITLESAGAQVGYDDNKSTAIIMHDHNRIEVPIGTDYIWKNNEKIQNDTYSVVSNGRTYLPIRIIFESLGYTVDWIQSSKTIDIYNYDYKDQSLEPIGFSVSNISDVVDLAENIKSGLIVYKDGQYYSTPKWRKMWSTINYHYYDISRDVNEAIYPETGWVRMTPEMTLQFGENTNEINNNLQSFSNSNSTFKQINDDANLLTVDEESNILNSFNAFYNKYQIKLFFVSITNNSSSDAWNYAWDYHHAYDLGNGEKGTMILLFDMDTRTVCVYTSGIAEGYIPERYAWDIEDEVIAVLSEGCFKGVQTFISSASRYMNAKVNYDEEQGVNGPVLYEGMIPAKLINDNWVICSENDKEWYDYRLSNNTELRFAGAVIDDDRTLQIGMTVPNDRIVYIWLPRYASNEDGSELFYSTIFLDWVSDELHVPDSFTNENHEELSGFWIEE